MTDENSQAAQMLVLVNDKSSSYQIVCAQAVGSAAYQAALILREYVSLATGAPPWEIASTPQAGPSIYVGDSSYLPSLGVNLSELAQEEFVIKVAGENLILAGPDGPGDPWYLNQGYGRTNTPTISAVSRFLEQYVGARWYWPGAPGVFGEKYDDLRGDLAVPASLDVREGPAFSLRDIQLPWSKDAYPLQRLEHLYPPARLAELGYASVKELAAALTQQNNRWIRLNRVGVIDRAWGQHYWWYLMPKAKYATDDLSALKKDSEKFFALYPPSRNDPDASDKPARGGGEEIKDFKKDKEGNYVKDPATGNKEYLPQYVMQAQLCVAGLKDESARPQVIGEVVARIRTVVENTPIPTMSIAPNDSTGHCECDQCRAKDEPKGSAVDLTSSGARNIGDRMFWFFNQVAAGLQEPRPRWLTTFAYGDYSLPYTLKNDAAHNPDYLMPNLIVYDTHNGYAATTCDLWQPTDENPTPNVRQEELYRFERWGTTTTDERGNEAGHLGVFTDPYFLNGLHPAVWGAQVCSPDALVDLVARLGVLHYMGGIFYLQNNIGLWGDRYLLARLLWNPGGDAADLDTRLAEVSAEAGKVLGDYFRGLFGLAADDVRGFCELANRYFQEYVRAATDNGGGKEGLPLKKALTHGGLFDAVFGQHREEYRACLDAADGRALNRVELNNLKMVRRHWAFTEQTCDFFDALDKCTQTGFYLIPYFLEPEGPAKLEELRELDACTRERQAAEDALNEDPDSCCKAVWPGAANAEYADWLTTKNRHSLYMPGVMKGVEAILKMQDDVDPLTVRRTDPYYCFRIDPEEVRNKVWVNWFTHDADEHNRATKTYIVLTNDTGESLTFDLTVRNMDPRMTRRRLRYHRRVRPIRPVSRLVRSPSLPTYQANTDDTGPWSQSEVVEDTYPVNAPPGVTVLLLEQANFAPRFSFNAYDSAANGVAAASYPQDKLQNIWLRMFMLAEDELLYDERQEGSTGCGRFFIVKCDSAGNEIKPAAEMTGFMTTSSANYAQMIDSRTWGTLPADQNLKTYIPAPTVNTTYHIYAAVYDRRGSKRLAVAPGGGAYVTLEVRPIGT